MGIKFRCPNGHKLNVKSFLAGKRGVCPDCQSTFRIPEEPGGSDIQAVALPSLKPVNGAAVTEEAVAVAIAPAPAAGPVPTGIPLPASPATMPAAVAAPGAAPATAVPDAIVPQGQPAAGDAIAEAPTAIWYVRPPSGGQYGPARGDVMRKWIAEGRVSGDSLVWREGWVDWRNAAQLFPSLAGGGAAAVPAAGPVLAAPQTARTASRYAARKKGGSGVAIAALIGLVLVCLVLVGVLVVVLTQQGS